MVRMSGVPPPVPKRRRSRKAYHFLLSCCLFFAILCACLITALVFIGKHYYYNSTVYKGAHQEAPQRLVTRLPRDVRPYHYDITLKPNLTSGGYHGLVNISLTTSNETEKIILHTKDLMIASVKLYNSSDVKVNIRDIAENVLDEILTITTVEPIPSDNYTLELSFVGTLLNRTKGFYMSRYLAEDGKTRRSIATSKFEPTYARQAFPCFDEPNMKAKFTIHLLKPKDTSYIALSNMPQDGETEVDNGIMVHFKESVAMSTYLACFIVSDFKASTDVIQSSLGDIPFKVYATPAQLNKTDYARRTGKKIMEFYLKYFNIPYPLPKLDMVAIPDFVSGAMEHWGLVTYRETALLYDPTISSTSNKQRVATVVAHELAHSWFGNLVTMNWWNDLWLNEGFASYIEYKGVDAAEPTWEMLSQFIVEDMHSVMVLDATLGSHPIVQTVDTPNQITEIFDSISYNKGASVLRMLENSVGEDVFQKGVTNYLNKNEYGNAVTQDLLNELQALVKTDINVTDFINTWTVQMGYPLVHARKIKGGYRLTQTRFLADPKNEGKDKSDTPYGYKWTIPITYITSNNSEPTLRWFKHSEEFIDVASDEKEEVWLKFNERQVGYYRVNYELEQWKNLIDNVKKLEASNRAHLIEESFSIASSSQLAYDVPLDLTKYLKEEFEYVPWVVAKRALGQIKSYMMNSPTYSDFKEYVVKIVTPAYENLTWSESEDDPHLRRHARVTVLGLACSMGHVECLAEVRKKFSRWLKGEETLSQDLRALVYEYGMIYASKAEWEQMWERFVAETDAAEKLKLLNGLASINDISLLLRLIDLAKDDTYIRSQDYFTCLSYISYNSAGTSLVWDYVRENWEVLVARFGLNERYLGRLIPSITKTFSTNIKKEEMLAFFAKYPDAGAGAAARVQALETVENNINWLERNKESVEAWIHKNKNFS